MTEERGEVVIEDEILARGFVQIPIAFLQHPDLGAGAKLAYGILLWYGWKGDGYPGHVKAAEAFGIGEKSLRRYLTRLETEGFIESERRGLTETNSYRVVKLTVQGGQTDRSERSNWAVPYKNQDSALDFNDGDGDPVSASALKETVKKACEIIGQPGEAGQLHTTAEKQDWQASDIEQAAERTRLRMERDDLDPLENPVAWMQDQAARIAEERKTAQKLQKRSDEERLGAAIGFARSMRDGVMNWPWDLVQSTVATSYPEEIAARAVEILKTEETETADAL